MSVTADIIQNLLDAKMGGAEILAVAKAMERGGDRDTIFILKDELLKVDCPSAAIGIAVYEVAEKIIEANSRSPIRMPRLRDEHSERKDSNRSRRGISDQHWRQLRFETFERDGWRCVYCGSEDDLTCDHIVPLVRGGTNDNDNLATACRPCNSSKSDKLISEWRRA